MIVLYSPPNPLTPKKGRRKRGAENALQNPEVLPELTERKKCVHAQPSSQSSTAPRAMGAPGIVEAIMVNVGVFAGSWREGERKGGRMKGGRCNTTLFPPGTWRLLQDRCWAASTRARPASRLQGLGSLWPGWTCPWHGVSHRRSRKELADPEGLVCQDRSGLCFPFKVPRPPRSWDLSRTSTEACP